LRLVAGIRGQQPSPRARGDNSTQAAKIMCDFLDKQSASHYKPSTDDNALIEDKPNIAILFGREDRGSNPTKSWLVLIIIQIDANPAYPVLYVASAVQVIAS
jgi:tRNA (cytidine32/uridine32-2'-O)-methyltransferase